MTDDREYRPEVSLRRMTAPLQFKVVSSPPDYSDVAVGSVVAVPVVRSPSSELELLGYLWFADAEDAAGYVPSAALSPDSDNAGAIWFHRLQQAKQEGLTPEAARLQMERGALTDRPGFADVENSFGAASVEELRSMLRG